MHSLFIRRLSAFHCILCVIFSFQMSKSKRWREGCDALPFLWFTPRFLEPVKCQNSLRIRKGSQSFSAHFLTVAYIAEEATLKKNKHLQDAQVVFILISKYSYQSIKAFTTLETSLHSRLVSTKMLSTNPYSWLKVNNGSLGHCLWD